AVKDQEHKECAGQRDRERQHEGARFEVGHRSLPLYRSNLVMRDTSRNPTVNRAATTSSTRMPGTVVVITRMMPGSMALMRNTAPTDIAPSAHTVLVVSLRMVPTSRRVSLRVSNVVAMLRSAVTREPPDRDATTRVDNSTPSSREGIRSRSSRTASSKLAPSFIDSAN